MKAGFPSPAAGKGGSRKQHTAQARPPKRQPLAFRLCNDQTADKNSSLLTAQVAAGAEAGSATSSKRGRPKGSTLKRKSSAAEDMDVDMAAPEAAAAAEQEPAAATAAAAGPVAGPAAGGPLATPAAAPKKRGRPPGSRNKPKPAAGADLPNAKSLKINKQK